MEANNDNTNVFRRAMALRKQGDSPAAMELLRVAIRDGCFSPEDADKAGRFIQKELSGDSSPAWRVLALGQCTTNWLTTSLVATAWGRGYAIKARDGEYDNVMQELMAGHDGDQADVVVLVPWNRRLLDEGSSASADQRLADELAFWMQAWKLAAQRSMRIVQVGYDFVSPGAAGAFLSAMHDGQIDLVRRMNQLIREHLPAGAYFLDLEQVSGAFGRRQFYDPRRYFWTKQPFSEAGTLALANALFAGVRATMIGPKKVLVLDLDNTLWGGVVGETGPLGVALGESPDGEAYIEFQKYCKSLTTRGVLLAVCSKNNPEDAREVFEKNPNMILRLEDFAAFQASWDPKSVVIERMAETLNLGLDSFVFVDDNPVERGEVRQALPQVEVIELPVEPAEYLRAVEAGLWFESVAITDADRKRVAQYRVEAQRRVHQTSFGTMDDYLRSLQITGDVRVIDDGDMQRVVQLIGKTNQFHLTTRRHSEQDVRKMLATDRSLGLTLRVKDKFGDYGLISLMIGVADGEVADAMQIDTWLMSCRVIGRTVEDFFFGQFMANAKSLGYKSLIGEYIPTKKNALVAGLYERLGFKAVSRDDACVRYQLELEHAPAIKTFVNPA